MGTVPSLDVVVKGGFGTLFVQFGQLEDRLLAADELSPELEDISDDDDSLMVLDDDFEAADFSCDIPSGMQMAPAPSRPQSLKSRLKAWLGKKKPIATASPIDTPIVELGSEAEKGNGATDSAIDSLRNLAASNHTELGNDAAGDFDAVDCTVFAPPMAQIGHHLLVQAFVHMPESADEARAAAQEFDDEAVKRGVTSLGTRLARGSQLQFELLMGSLEVEDPVQELTWNGRTESVEFEVFVPRDASTGTTIGKLLVTQDSIPIGTIRFKLTISSSAAKADDVPEPVGHAHRYRKAFISYASKDRSEVLRRTQMLSAAGITFFQDVFDLRAGDKWSEKLYQHIDESDVLFLFWSMAAKESEWVQKEWRYALVKKGDDFIRPVILEGPPIHPPPTELEHLHFDDRALYYLAAGR